MTLTEFLEARIAEDEAVADRMHRWDCGIIVVHEDLELSDALGCDCGLPARVLRECEAKRKLIDEIVEYEANQDFEHGDGYSSASEILARAVQFDAIRVLASIYSDHPDYNPEWA